MGVLNPLLLWGTAGISVPILIHLLNRFRHREIEWAAMALLRKALVVRSRQIRLEDLLVLILRCLAIALIALAMARPTLRAGGASWLGKDARVGVVVAVDGSYSMAHRPGVQSRFRRAVERVREVLGTLDPGSPVSVVLMGARPRTLARNEGYDKERMDKLLRDAAPMPERLNLELCLEQLKPLIHEIKAPARECYIVTDAQVTSWQELSEEAKQHLSDLGRASTLFFLSTPATSVENVAVTQFTLGGGTLRKDTMARYVAEVRNFGERPVEDVAVALLVDDRPVDRRVLRRLGPGERESVPLFARFERAGTVRLSARIDKDALVVDDTRHAVAQIRERLRVLCVDGDPSNEPFGGETDYLATALVPRRPGTARATLEVKTISWLELAAQRLAEFHVVILANVPDIPRRQVAALASFVERGGGLVLFLGDKIVPRLFNARMKLDGASLSPAQIIGAGNPGLRHRGWSLAPTSSDHPLARPLTLVPEALLRRARFKQFLRVRPLEDSRVVLSLAGNEAPFLLERRRGLGRVLLFTSTADRAWSNFVVHPLGPIVLHQAVTYLTRQAHERPFTVGEPLVIPVSMPAANVFFRDPKGQETAVQATERDGERVAEFPNTEQSGFYAVRGATGGPPLAVAVNVDATESDVKTLRDRALATALRGVPVRLLPAGEDVLAEIKESRVGVEFWRMLLFAGLAVLLLEQYLAHRFSRRMAIRDDLMPESSPDELLSASEPIEV